MSGRSLAILLCIGLACAAVLPARGSADDRHYALAADVRLGTRMASLLSRIAARFHQRTGRGIYVTSGTRSPREQARAMYHKIRLGQRLTRLYRDYDAASEIQRAYRRHRRAGANACVRAMARVIRAQVRQGCYISRHLRASAVDVRSRDMTRRQQRIFSQVVADFEGVSLLHEGRPPHFHLEARR